MFRFLITAYSVQRKMFFVTWLLFMDRSLNQRKKLRMKQKRGFLFSEVLGCWIRYISTFCFKVEFSSRTQMKKRLIFPGKTSKNKNKKRAVSKIEKPSKDEASTDHSTPPEHHDTPDDTEVERTVRKSTRTSVIVRQAERDAIRAALQATMKVNPEYSRHLICRTKIKPLE